MEFQEELEALYKKALECKTQGRVAESEILEAQAAGIFQALKNRVEKAPDDPSSAGPLLYLAEREWPILGDHADVLDKIQRALDLRKKQFGVEHGLTAEALTKLAEFHYLAGRFREAEPLYRQSIAVYEKLGVTEDSVYAKALEGLAQTLSADGRAEEADLYFVRAIERVSSDEQGKRSHYFLLIYRAQGLEKLNRHSEAEALRQKAGLLLPTANPGEFGYHA